MESLKYITDEQGKLPLRLLTLLKDKISNNQKFYTSNLDSSTLVVGFEKMGIKSISKESQISTNPSQIQDSMIQIDMQNDKTMEVNDLKEPDNLGSNIA